MKKHHNKNVGTRLLFVGYGVLMLYLLFVRNRTSASGLPYLQQVAENFNYVPFHTIKNFWDILVRPEYYIDKWEAAAVYEQQAKIAVVNLVGNVVMFIPLGFFLPKLWKGLQKLWKTFLVSAELIVLVELAQLITLRGCCDIDDLILNLIGTILGYALWRLLRLFRCNS